ncbi:MAG: hypothetical protein KME45_00890 [Stenomitos rutilans HA7619-LM2]|jgi:CheY-like chemotaxis protein|nr:hypothetical protein [Stenomitos rutilans HA7619-LM2]
MNQRHTLSPRLFVVEPDNDVRPSLKTNLQNWGYDVIMALDEADAIQRSQGVHQQFGLILLNQYKQPIEATLAIGQRIRENTKPARDVPILILAEQYGDDLEGQNVPIGDHEYVLYLEDAEQLKVMLQRLCPVA